MAELSREEARRIVRLVYVADLEGRADGKDWELARRLASEFGMPEPEADNRETWPFYWPEDQGAEE